MSSLPHHIFTTQEIRLIEQEHASANNGHCYDLMEKAGRSVFEVMRKVNSQPKMVYVLAGKGNNGGDGYIVAAYLLKHHIPFRIFALGTPRKESEAFAAYSFFIKLGGKVEEQLPDLVAEAQSGNSPDIVIDALLGTGLDSAPRDPFDKWIEFINSTKAYIISVDVPSGVNADTGKVYNDSVIANKTVCMLGLKAGLLTGDAIDYVGEIEVHSLGVDVNAFHGKYLASETDGASYVPTYLSTYEDIIADLPRRPLSAHKGDSGRVLLMGGSLGFGGAINICGHGALRTGAGLIKIATDKANIPSINASRPELMTVDFTDLDSVKEALEWTDVIAIGPGLGLGEHAEQLLDLVLNADKPTVVDADALTLMSRRDLSYSKRTILTPHPGEAARLLSCSISKINDNRYWAVYELQKRCGGIVLLKGAGTLVCDGSRIVLIKEGSPALASGGMGDILTGIIASLKAQGLTLMQAACAGACIHGRSGYLSGENCGLIGTAACDLLPYIRYLVNKRPGLADSHHDKIVSLAERATSMLLENKIMH